MFVPESVYLLNNVMYWGLKLEQNKQKKQISIGKIEDRDGPSPFSTLIFIFAAFRENS